MTDVRPDIGIIILAAGSSSRMGQSKQLLEIDHEPLLLRTCRIALQSKAGGMVIVVLGACEQEHRSLLVNLSVTITHNPQWQKGMGSSLKEGLKNFIKICPSANAVIVLVCDQPLLNTEIINNLIQEFLSTHKPIVASRYAETLGVPVLFNKHYFDSILNLHDAEGAKKILQQNKHDVVVVEFPEGATDLDTAEDYQLFLKHRNSTNPK